MSTLDSVIMEPTRLVKQLDFALQLKKERERGGRRNKQKRTVERNRLRVEKHAERATTL